MSSKRRGISTILGTLIFIGVLFSAIIPMELVMKQADTYYAQAIKENSQFEYEKASEDMKMYAYPVGDTSNEIRVKVDNRCEMPIEITRLWIRDEYISINESVPVSGSETFGPYTVDLQADTSYPIRVVTGRGNKFGSISDNLYYGDGVWYTPSLGISVNIANEKGKYYIKVSNATWSVEYLTQGQDFGDLIKYFEVSEPGNYYVIARKSTGGGYVDLPGTPMTVVIQWPDGTPIVFVYTSGLDT